MRPSAFKRIFGLVKVFLLIRAGTTFTTITLVLLLNHSNTLILF